MLAQMNQNGGRLVNKPLVLIGYSACPLTRAAFELAGCDVWTCDLLPSRGGQNRHMQCDIWEALPAKEWSLAVLHPMCTYLTVSAAWAYKDPDFAKYPDGGYHQKLKPGTLTGAARREAREAELENFRRLLALPFPCAIENPGRSFINTAIRPPDQVLHPYEFGDDASKLTGLWLTNGVPHLRHTSLYEPRWVCCGIPLQIDIVGKYGCANCNGDGRAMPRWGNQTDSGQNKLSPSDGRWLERSKTWPGIAAAMGDQWGRWVVRRTVVDA